MTGDDRAAPTRGLWASQGETMQARQYRPALAAENARLRAQVQAVEALRPVRHACSTGVWLHYQDVRTALTSEPDDRADLVEHVRRAETRLETANQELRDTWAALDLALGIGQTVNTPALSVKILAEERDALAAEVDRCDGCGSSLSRCLRWHEKREGMGKCCPECKHPGEAAGWATLRTERDALAAESARLRAQVEAVEALHQPHRVYDECYCTDEQRDLVEHVEVDEVGFTCRVIAVVCSTCCIARDYQSEECADYHEHTLDEADRCATVRALATTEAGEES